MTQIQYTIAVLDVPAVLRDGPKTAAELASIVGAFTRRPPNRLQTVAVRRD